jgi:plastocyanin
VAPPAGLVKIAYRNIMISPATVTITAGTSVTWTDFDPTATPHNVAVQSGPQTFTSPTLDMGSTYTFKFTKPGVYNYICSFHPTAMIGKITVVR